MSRVMRGRQATGAALFCIATLPARAGSATAEPLNCPSGAATVVAPTGAQAMAVCDHVDVSLAQFAACDLGTPPPIALTVVPDLGAGCFGLFHCGEDRIEVVSPAGIDAARDMLKVFGHVPARRLFASVIHHEMAHALYEQTPCPYDSCLATSEYFAYTQQIAALTPEDRAPIAARLPEGTQVTHDEINAFILFMAPEVFVPKAWAHFNARPDACATWQGVLDGVILFDRFHP